MKLLEQVEKYIFTNEVAAEKFINDTKTTAEFELIDRKITQKETKDNIFYLVSIKKRFMTLSDAKEEMGL